jgi:hypothetical protein
MLKNGRNDKAYTGAFMGCSCCNSKQTRRRGKHAVRQEERRAWRRDQGL